jgi:tetratricopeptide (TPR) repeat protein
VQPTGPIEAPLTCTTCQRTELYKLTALYFAPLAARGLDVLLSPTWDGWYTPMVITCAHCGAVDTWTVERSWARRPLPELVAAGVIPAICRLPNRKPMYRGSQAESALRALAEANPGSAELWRRLGNQQSQGLRHDLARESWRRAAEDPDEVEAVASYANTAFDTEDLQEAVDWAAETLDRLPKADRAARERIVPQMLEILYQEAPQLYLTASWLDEQPARNGQRIVNLSSVRLDQPRDPQALERFLIQADLLTLKILNDRPPGYEPSESRLLALLSGRSTSGLPSHLVTWSGERADLEPRPLPPPRDDEAEARKRAHKARKQEKAARKKQRGG